jgi:Rne/Rng family ribonuclease
MTREMVISANRHETKVAILEDDQLVEVYFQRANEYSLVGSIHKGRVTRVLPGMQSAFVDLGLERDAFLYVSDFFEDTGEDYERVSSAPEKARRPEPRGGGGEAAEGEPAERRGRRGRRRRNRGRSLPESKFAAAPAARDTAAEQAQETPVEVEEPLVLPGESLAKYRDRIQAAPVEPEGEGEAGMEAEAESGTGVEAEAEGEPGGEGDNGIDAAEMLADRLFEERRRAETLVGEPEESEEEGEEDKEALDLEAEEPSIEVEPVSAAEEAAEAADEETAATAEEEEKDEREEEAIQVRAAAGVGSAGEALEETAEGQEELADESGQEEAHSGAGASASIREEYLPRYIQPRPARMRRRRMRGDRRERGERPEAAHHERRQPAPDHEAAPAPERPPEKAEEPERPSITDLLKEGQEIIVQIAKEPLGQKGARITSHIAIPGRYVVYMPTLDHLGVSRKISTEEERQRLKRVVQNHSVGMSGGFIVRTAGEGRTEEEIAADMSFLYNLWLDIRQKAERRKAPCLLHHDLELVRRTLRDQLNETYRAVWVDNEETYESIIHFLERFQPSMVSRVKLYTRPTPIFEAFNVTAELEKALRPKVWLKSGGYIVINQTEALVAIDINTGKFVGKSNRLEDTIVKTNTEAIKEIVRQIRLRDLGGIIVVDFIDMDERRNRQKVMQALEEAMRADRAPYKILQFNDFGLVAITRRRVKQSLERTLCTPCPVCEGAGYVKSPRTVVSEVLTEARKLAPVVEGKEVILRVHPDVARLVKSSPERYLEELEEILGRPVLVKGDPLLHPEKFDLG